MRAVVSLMVAAAVCAASSVAGAQERVVTGDVSTTHEAHEAAERARAERDFDRRKGWDFTLHAGVGGHTDLSSDAFLSVQGQRANDRLFWPGFGAQLTFGHRFNRWFGRGTHVAYQHYTVDNLPVGATGGMANTFAHGAYARLYGGRLLGSERFDPWLAAGVEWSATAWFDHDRPAGDTRARFTTVAIPISLGLEYFVTRHITLGAMGQVSPWIPWERCANDPGGPTICTRDGLNVNTYLFGGAGVHVFLPD